MTTYARTNTSGLAWTNTSAWTPTGAPTTAADAATFTSFITAANSTTAATATVGQIEVTNPSAAITIAASASQIITISPAASFSNIGIKLTGSTGGNLTIAAEVTLASSQEWQVASGRTLTVTGVISGTGRNVTFTGGGTTSINGINTAWTNSQLIVAGGLVIATENRALGASTNSVVVQSGGALRLTGTQSINPTSFVVSGQGASGLQAGSIYIVDSLRFISGKTIELQGASPTIGVNAGASGSFAGGIIGNPTGDVTFNMVGTNTANPTFTGTSSTFTVQSGQRVVLQGVNPVGAGVETAADFFFGATDLAGLGNAANKVTVKNSVRLTTVAPNLPILSRDYFFEGETSFTTPIAPKVASIAPVAGSTAMTFQGTITGTAGNWVKASVVSGSGVHPIKFAGVLQGSWNLRSFSSVQTIYLDTTLDVSGWTGNLWAHRVAYGKAPTGAATYESGAVIDNISGAALTLAHSSYTLNGSLTFTGTDDLSFGSGSVSSGAVTFTTSTAGKRLSIPGNITGTGTVALGKTGAGTLRLSGNNTGFTSFPHQGGVLELDSAGSAGQTGTTFTLTAAFPNTLDSTTGATLLQSGNVSLNADFTWGGSANLTFGSGALSWGAARTISFLNGKNGTLRFPGNIGAISATFTLSIGGSPVGGSRSRLWLSGTNGMLATANTVTAGYLRVSNSAGLGNAATTMWTISSGAALELDGGISPTSARSCTITGPGPNTDGALRSVSGSNTWNGGITVPVQSLASPTRIQVDAGTFTLSASANTTIDPTTTGTPLQFTALGSTAVLNQPRQFTNKVSDVVINNGGAGTVVLSVANNHTGGTTVEGGTCKVTDVNATSTGTVQVNATATLESTVQSQFTTLRLGQTGSGARAILKFAA